MTWEEVVSAQREAAREIEAQPLTPDGSDAVVRLVNQAQHTMRRWWRLHEDVAPSDEEWKPVWELCQDAWLRWCRRYRPVMRDHAIEQLRADHVALAERATRCA